MPRDGLQTRQRILTSAYREFRRRGFTRVGMDEVAAAANVTKRTLYYHFKSKDELFAAMFEEQHKLAMTACKSMFERMKGDPEQIVEAIFSELITWSSKPRWSGSGFTRVAVELADLPGHPARVIAKRHKMMIVNRFAELFTGDSVRSPQEIARSVYLLAEGAIAMVLITGDQNYALTAMELAKNLVRQKRKHRASTSPRKVTMLQA